MKLLTSKLAVLYVAGVLVIHGLVVWNARDLILKGYPDFTIYYTAGTMIRQGMGHELYNNTAQFILQQQFAPQVATRLGALPFNHPPFEALLFVPFAYFPYRVAYLLWTLVNLGMLAYLPILLRPYVPVLARLPSFAWTIASLAFFPIFFALLQGQDAILLMFLYGLAFVALKQQRLVSAGAWLACGLFKFHLVLPFLFLLLIQQKTFQERKRTLYGFVGVSALLGLLSLAAVGVKQMIFYPHYVLGLEATMAKGAIMPSDMPNLRGVLYLMASQMHHFDMLVLSLSAILFVVTAWSLHSADGTERNMDAAVDEDLKFALAVLATVLVSYHGLGYDLCILALPMLLLAELAKKRLRSSAWTRAAVVAGLALLLLSPLQLILLMRYNKLAFLGWAVLFCFVGLYGELKFRAQHSAVFAGN
jgi:Glycosyltransferase family 87